MFKHIILIFLLFVSLILVGCTSQTADPIPAPITTADLTAVKQYTLDNAQQMKQGTAQLLTTAQAYYSLVESNGFDYQAVWNNHAGEAAPLVADAKAAWLLASTHYELDEGIIAGVPSLAFYLDGKFPRPKATVTQSGDRTVCGLNLVGLYQYVPRRL